MIKTHRYSQAKFASFSPEKQLKAIMAMLAALENNLAEDDFRQEIIPVILDCLNWSVPEVRKDLRDLEKLTPETAPHEALRLIDPLLRLYGKSCNEKEPLVYRYDGRVLGPLHKVPYPLTVIADNLRSRYNLGAIYRTAECVKARWMYLCGITAFPPLNACLKTAMGTQERVPYTLVSQTAEAIRYCRKDGLPVLALETASHAVNLFEYKPEKPVALILGNEALGIEEEILQQADGVLYIPTYGWKNSLNVSNAFALAAYHLSGITVKS